MGVIWHETYDNVTALGAWLLTERRFSAVDLQVYYEKPWHSTVEWRQFQKELGITTYEH